jgi:hypothetical protein
MAHYKVGDRFKTDYSPKRFKGSILEIIEVLDGYEYPYRVKVVKKGEGYESVGYTGSWKDSGGNDMIIIKNKKTLMTTVTNMMKKFLDADTQLLVKAGFIDSELEITAYGQRALDEIIFDQNKVALVESAKISIAEEEAKNK